MKNYIKFKILLISIGVFLISSQNIFAQDTVDVDFGDNTLVTALAANPGKVLRLTGGSGTNGEGLYIVNESLQDPAGGDIKIVGVNGPNGLPPRIMNTMNGSSGRMIKPLGDLSLENVMLMGRSLDGFDQYKGVILITKDRSNITLKKVWFEYGNLIRNQGKNINFVAEDCTWMNIIDQEGLALYQRVPIDSGSFRYTNCSFINSDGLILYTKAAGAPHNFTVEHCTFYRVLEGITGGGQFTKNVNWKNNLFIDVAFEAYSTQYGTRRPEQLPPAIFPIDTISTELMTDRTFSINNNVFWTSPEIKTWYGTLSNLQEFVPINPTGQAIINAIDGCKYENNIEFTQDPNIVQGIPFTDASWDSAKVRVNANFADQSKRTDWTWYVDDTPDADYDYKVWPYPINLKPQNEALWDSGDDGYPVGDLNWFSPEIKAAWLAGEDNPIVGVEESNKVVESYSLEQNYPNPFNPTTTIRYSIKENVNVNISIYNVIGQKVVTLVNQKQGQGSYSVNWNGRDSYNNTLSSGIYLYKINAGDFSQSRKMMLLK